MVLIKVGEGEEGWGDISRNFKSQARLLKNKMGALPQANKDWKARILGEPQKHPYLFTTLWSSLAENLSFH